MRYIRNKSDKRENENTELCIYEQNDDRDNEYMTSSHITFLLITLLFVHVIYFHQINQISVAIKY